MGNLLIIIGYVIGTILGLACLICVSSIISHVVRRHILFDRQQELVSKINWMIRQHSNEAEIEQMKYDEQNVFNTMTQHKKMIILNIVNILVILVLASIVTVILVVGK